VPDSDANARQPVERVIGRNRSLFADELLLDVETLNHKGQFVDGAGRAVNVEDGLDHRVGALAGLERHVADAPELRGEKAAEEDCQQRDVDGVCTEAIPSAALAEDEDLPAFLRHHRVEAGGAKGRGNPLGHGLLPFTGEEDRGALLLTFEPARRGIKLLLGDVGRGEAVNRGQNDVEREDEQQDVEVPRVIDVEEAELAEQEARGRRHLRVVLIEALDVDLHDDHADHAGDDEQDEQDDAEAHTAQ
jgi:hypothetical protein